jgi:hypothetical protein
LKRPKVREKSKEFTMRFKPVLFAALLVAALAITVPAQAQSFAGTFQLPYDTQWGATVLPAGTYSVFTDIPIDSSVIKVVGNGTSAVILAPPSRPRDFSPSGNLELREINGKYVVTKFTAGPVGREFSFAAPKSRGDRLNTASATIHVASIGH